ncbi:MAG: hypothetical protein PHS74_05375 [Lachnospiraceae bacterium]|nr:hypothetical protein [Lachnospiraceae bacterium]
MKKVTEWCEKFLTGDTTMTKKELWLTITSCTLLGVLIGLIVAPVTKGVMIGSNNGNGNGCGNTEYNDDTEEPECIGVCD